MGRGPELTFFQRKHTESQETHEKTLNITNHQGNAYKNNMRYHLTPVRMAIIKKTSNKKKIKKKKTSNNKCRRG